MIYSPTFSSVNSKENIRLTKKSIGVFHKIFIENPNKFLANPVHLLLSEPFKNFPTC